MISLDPEKFHVLLHRDPPMELLECRWLFFFLWPGYTVSHLQQFLGWFLSKKFIQRFERMASDVDDFSNNVTPKWCWTVRESSPKCPKKKSGLGTNTIYIILNKTFYRPGSFIGRSSKIFSGKEFFWYHPPTSLKNPSNYEAEITHFNMSVFFCSLKPDGFSRWAPENQLNQ